MDSGRTIRYAYDPLRRLTTATTNGSANYPQWGLSGTYDRYGNRSAQQVTVGSGPSVSLTFNQTKNQPSGYTYDASGNLTIEPVLPPNNYGYDAEDDLISVQGNGGSATHTYDGHGLRIQKTVQGGTSTVYIFSNSRVIAEYDNGAVPTSPSREYIYSGGALAAKIESGATQYYHADHLSVRVITDSNGNKIGEQGHYPFGEAWYRSNTTSKWLFTSYERDAESGLDYAIFRYYNNRIAAFCSADPLQGRPGDPQSWNRYAYVENDPVNMTDPSGQGFWSWLFRIFLVLLQVLFHIPVGGFGAINIPSSGGATPPTFGGPNFDWSTQLPGYNPNTVYGTPPFLPAGGSFSLSAWIAQTATAGNGPAQVNVALLGGCTFSIFGVTLNSFTQSTAHSNGSFTGTKAGIYTGLNTPDAPGPYQFKVTNDTSMSLRAVTINYYVARSTYGTPDTSPEPVAGFTNPRDSTYGPFRNTTANDLAPNAIVDTQIWELGNSLGFITHTAPATINTNPGPGNTEPGRKLLECYQRRAAGPR